MAKLGNEKLKIYRAELNTFKTKHRNKFIAHRNGEEYPDPFSLPDYREDFHGLIQRAVEILEYLWQGKMEFGYNIGSDLPKIDFKNELELD